MAQVTVSKIGGLSPQFYSDIYTSLAIGDSATFTRAPDQISGMAGITSGVAAGDLTMAVVYSTDEIAAGVVGSVDTAKAPVRAATTAPITLSAPQTVDGVVLIAGDRVLVKDQASAPTNGIYIVAAGAWGRSSDAASSSDFETSMTVAVQEGTVNATTLWLLSTPMPISLGVTGLTWSAQITAALTGSAPADVTKAAAVVGVSGTAARSDHKHDITTAAASTSGLANAEGSATSLARSDHTHLQAAASVVAANIGVKDAGGIGVAQVLRVVLTSGGAAGTADDVSVYTANAPYKFRIVDAYAVIATAHAGAMALYSLASGAGTKYCADIDPTSAGINRQVGTTPTVTSTVAANGSLFLNRADRSVTGELFVTIIRET